MLNQNHPDDERLSALASHETDATADAALALHVSSCDRCAELVAELGSLRSALADLPDLAPSRPLRLLPEVSAPSGIDRAGGWARRVFAPVLTAGAALAMVGLVGTASPALDGLASGAAPGQGDAAQQEAATDGTGSVFGGEDAGAPAADAPAADDFDDVSSETARDRLSAAGDESPDVSVFGGDTDTSLPAERSPWPMLLFTGVALMVAAALLRWILVPRAG